MRGIWLLPTRRRIEKLRTFLIGAIRNNVNTPGVILVQKDELAELRDQYVNLTMPRNWSILPTNADGFGDKHREVWGAIKDLDWVGIACDDLRPMTSRWDQLLLDKINGQNIVTCNDGQQGNARMSGITVFSGAVLRTMGYCFPPAFWHTWVDNVWEDIGRGANCWTYVPEVLITHDHPFVNQQIDPAKADETTYKSYGRMAEDQAAYAAWCRDERAAVIERVRALAAI